MTATGPSMPPFGRSSVSASILPSSGETPRVSKYDPLTQAPETIRASPRGTRLKSVDDHARLPSKTSSANRRNESHTPTAYARTPGTVASVTRTSALGSLTASLRSSRLFVREKITTLAPIPRASDRAATPVTRGVALRDRTADRRSFIDASIDEQACEWELQRHLQRRRSGISTSDTRPG